MKIDKFDTKNLFRTRSFYKIRIFVVAASSLHSKSGDQPGRGREPETHHGRKSSDPEVIEAGQGHSIVSIAGGTQKVSLLFFGLSRAFINYVTKFFQFFTPYFACLYPMLQCHIKAYPLLPILAWRHLWMPFNNIFLLSVLLTVSWMSFFLTLVLAKELRHLIDVYKPTSYHRVRDVCCVFRPANACLGI